MTIFVHFDGVFSYSEPLFNYYWVNFILLFLFDSKSVCSLVVCAVTI